MSIGPQCCNTKEEMQKTWDRAQSFLKRRRTEDVDGKSKPRKQPHRVISFEWLLCLDNALVVMTGHGLEFWVLTDEDLEASEHPEDLPMLNGAADQGPDGLCAENACKYGPLHINLELADDDCHGDHNDQQNAIQDVGLFSHQKLVDLARNAHQGPWGTAATHNSMADAIGDYIDSGAVDVCPMFDQTLPEILDEAGEPERITEPGIRNEIKERSTTHPSFVNRGAVANSERFCDPARRAAEGDRVWSLRSLGFLILQMQRGEINPKKLTLLDTAAGKIKPRAEEAPAVPTGQAMENVIQEMRRNALQCGDCHVCVRKSRE